MPAQTTVPPGATWASASGTSAPRGAKTIAASRGRGGASFDEPAQTAPRLRANCCAASSPGDFKEAYERAFAEGAGSIVSIHVAGSLSGTIKSAQIARDMLPDREIHIVDSQGASMAEGILCRMAVEMAVEGRSAEQVLCWRWQCSGAGRPC